MAARIKIKSCSVQCEFTPRIYQGRSREARTNLALRAIFVVEKQRETVKN
jgi:hypothetical protein